MQKPIYVLQPDHINSLIPEFVKSFIKSIILTLIIFSIVTVANVLEIADWRISRGQYFLIVLLLTIIPNIFVFFSLWITQYIFYKDHVVVEQRFIFVRRKSAPYNKITNISTEVSIWDRLCEAGDLTLHTAEDTSPDIKLRYVENPEEVEEMIYRLMKRK